MAFCVPLWSKILPLRTGGGEGVLVAQILLYLPRYKKGWFNKRDVYTLVLRTVVSAIDYEAPIDSLSGSSLHVVNPMVC